MTEFPERKVLTLPGGLELSFVLIPSGHFRFGMDNVPISIESFYLSMYPVTVQQFRCFTDANGYSNMDYWSHSGWKWREIYDVKSDSFRKIPVIFKTK